MKQIKHYFLLLFSATILLCSSWYYGSLSTPTPLVEKELSNDVDTIITQLRVKQFDARGQIINSLKSPYMQHIPKGDIHVFEKPYIIISQEDQPAWEIQSNKAQSYDGGDKIIFMEQVIVHQNPGNTSQESTLKTEEITYYPKEKRATTNLFVRFEQPGNSIQSMGMNAYLDEKRVELLHQARGRYEPAKG